MNECLRAHAEKIVRYAIDAVLPDEAVKKALKTERFAGRVMLVAVGKAAWQMANSAVACLGNQITDGIVISKYGHIGGEIAGVKCWEAGHPVPDENTYQATEAVIEMVGGLTERDTVLFLLSGGGSALFEKPLVLPEEMQNITNQLLRCGADIVEMNTIRKRLSAVKGGRFAKMCEPAQVFSVVLSDIIGDPLDMIASGPACEDRTTCSQAMEIARKYDLQLSKEAWLCLQTETPKVVGNVKTQITGSVRQLCTAAAEACRSLGYEPHILTDQLCCQAKEAGSFLASVVRSNADTKQPLAFIAGGETVVQVTGSGKGGRNQELAMGAAIGLEGLHHAAVISVGSDGTDGPTDAAGGYVDGDTIRVLREKGISAFAVLQNNDAYHALQEAGGLIMTGPTGTNVNDVAVALIQDAKILLEKTKNYGIMDAVASGL